MRYSWLTSLRSCVSSPDTVQQRFVEQITETPTIFIFGLEVPKSSRQVNVSVNMQRQISALRFGGAALQFIAVGQRYGADN